MRRSRGARSLWNADERDGYVPNVLYSCGSMLHGDRLIIPYAIADSYTSIATVSMSELVARLMRAESRTIPPVAS